MKHIEQAELELSEPPTDPNRIGDIAEHYAITYLWDSGYNVYKNCGCTGPVDLVAMTPEGKIILVDVKSLHGGKLGGRTDEQKRICGAQSMKKLETVVEDIYETLSCLCDQKDLDIPEEDIEDFGERMKNVIRHWSKPHQESRGLRMSNVGRPLRRLWYDLKKDRPLYNRADPHTFIKFLYGHMLEEVVLLLVKLSGHEVKDEQKEVEVDGGIGHIDCKIDGEVVDIKTASNFAFKKFKDGTLHTSDPFGYMGQLSGYEEPEGTSDGGFVALNKESGELALHRPAEMAERVWLLST